MDVAVSMPLIIVKHQFTVILVAMSLEQKSTILFIKMLKNHSSILLRILVMAAHLLLPVTAKEHTIQFAY